MSRIKNSDTRPEIALRKLIYNNGFRGYRTHYKLPGRPDIVFSKKRVAIFLDGCFWHKCPKCNLNTPKSNRPFWRNKIESNVKRDKIINKTLKKMGWRVIRIWEHEIWNSTAFCLKKIKKVLENQH